jgi:hypothetical protein
MSVAANVNPGKEKEKLLLYKEIPIYEEPG